MAGPDHGPQLTELRASLNTLVYWVHLLQRQLLRADGLSTLERDLLLTTVGEVQTTVRRLQQQIAPGPAPTDPPSRSDTNDRSGTW